MSKHCKCVIVEPEVTTARDCYEEAAKVLRRADYPTHVGGGGA